MKFNTPKGTRDEKTQEAPVFLLYRNACSETLAIGQLETEMIDSIIPEFREAIGTLISRPELRGIWVERNGKTWYVQQA